MTRDYTKIPGYERMTGPQARYNYLHDLLEEYQGATPEGINRMEGCPRAKRAGGCNTCTFSALLGGSTAVCCAWRAEAQPDKAIEILEMLLDRRPTETNTIKVIKPRTEAEKIRAIARHYGKEPQIGVAQEECAELIQAISKVRRKGETKDAIDHLAEEIADVRIMCAQLMHLYRIVGLVTVISNSKLDRQLERIAEGDTAYETTGE